MADEDALAATTLASPAADAAGDSAAQTIPEVTEREAIAFGATVAHSGEASAPAPGLGSDPLGVARTHGSKTDGAARPSAGTPLFGPYTRIEVLAEQGSIGLVARGYNDGFGRWELLKFLRAELARDPELVLQFRREGRVLAQLSHPNVVQVYATYEVDGRTCLALEFLEGEALSALTAQKPLSVERGLSLFADAARGLAAAHEVGLLHRDLKPDNLFVSARGLGRSAGLKLIDFGLATAERHRHAQVDGLVSGTIGGTPLYMAPELMRGAEATRATDLYALGMTFFVAFAGRHPLDVATSDELRRALLGPEPIASLARFRGDLPGDLVALIDLLVARDAAARPQSADDVLAWVSAIAPDSRTRVVPATGPFPGAAAYDEVHADVFFGREREIAELVERARRGVPSVVVGARGSGRSSLLRAGVGPRIAGGALGATSVYRVVPVRLGAAPLTALTRALAVAAEVDEQVLRQLIAGEGAGASASAAARVVAELIRALPASTGLLVLVDDLAPLLDVEPARAKDAGLAGELLAAFFERADPRLVLLSSLASDRVEQALAQPALQQLLARGFVPLRPLSGDTLARAAVDAARAAGFRFEQPRQLGEICDAAEAAPIGAAGAALVLSDWWAARDVAERTLPAAWLDRTGGLGAALGRRAEAVLAALDGEGRAAAEGALTRLVGAGHAARRELEDPAVSGAAGRRTIERLIDERVVVESGGSVVLGHPDLARAWPWLSALAGGSSDDRALLDRLTHSARAWDLAGRPDALLWRGPAAARLARWFDGSNLKLSQHELGFVESNRALARRERGRRAAFAVVTVALIVLVGAALARERRRGDTLRADAARDVASASQRYRDDTRALLRTLALAQVDLDPADALRAARRASELQDDPSLDVIGWRAVARGVPRSLPKHAVGPTWLAVQGGNLIATGGVGPEVHLLRADSEWHRSVTLPRDDPATALTLGAEPSRVLAGTTRGALVGAVVASGAPVTSTYCTSALREISTGHGRSLLACEAELVLVEDGAGQRHETLAKTSLSALLPEGAGAAWIDARLERRAFDPAGVAHLDLPRGLVARDLRIARDVALVTGQDGSAWLIGDSDARAIVTAGAPLRSAHLAPDGQRAWLVGATSRGRLLDRRGEEIGRIEGASRVARFIAGDRVAVATESGDVLVLASSDGARLATLRGTGRAVTDLAFASDEGWLLVATSDGATRAYELGFAAWSPVARPAPSPEVVSLDGARVTFRIGGAPERSLDLGRKARSWAWSDEHRQLAVGSDDGSVSFVDVAEARVARVTRPFLKTPVTAIAHGGEDHWFAANELGRVVEVGEDAPDALDHLRASVRCLVTVGPRALVAVAESGDARLVDRVTHQGFALGTVPRPESCAAGDDDRMTVITTDGRAFTRTVQTRPVWMLPQPGDVPELARWRGLGELSGRGR